MFLLKKPSNWIIFLYGRVFRINEIHLQVEDCVYLIRTYIPSDFTHVLFRHEPEVHDFVLYPLGKGDVFVDVGAHIGEHTVRGGRKAGETGVVIAVEPDPTNFQLLTRNVSLNGCPNVRLYNCAAWNQNAELTFLSSLSLPNLSSVFPLGIKGKVKRLKVKGRTLDSIINESLNEARRIKLVKIDVEGSEFHVLKGIEKNLDKTENLVVEVWKRNFSLVTSFLKDKGFNVHIISRQTTPRLTFFNILATHTRA